jgi:broad specificity phosphatase PhoE
VPKTITLIRHAETNSNREQRWQGNSESGISPHGEDQLRRLAERFGDFKPDLLVASDLPRTMRTAEVFGSATPDAAWREFAIGSWEGLTTDEVIDRHPEDFQAFVRGEDVAPGGGELMSDFGRRISGAFNRLVESMANDSHAVVVAHGGSIWSLVSHLLGIRGGAALIPSHNTARTEVIVYENGDQKVHIFNDASHLDEVSQQFGPAGQMVTFVRHGQSEGNVAGTWDGRINSALTKRGISQATAAAAVAPRVPTIFTSPLRRAASTAALIGDAIDVEPIPDDGLMEMYFGGWEGLTTVEILENYREEFEAYADGSTDDPVGSTGGESLGAVGERMAATLATMGNRSNGHPFVAVSHGAAIRALALNVLGLKNIGRQRLIVPRNTSMTSLVLTETRPVVASYNVAPHMDE